MTAAHAKTVNKRFIKKPLPSIRAAVGASLYCPVTLRQAEVSANYPVGWAAPREAFASPRGDRDGFVAQKNTTPAQKAKGRVKGHS